MGVRLVAGDFIAVLHSFDRLSSVIIISCCFLQVKEFMHQSLSTCLLHPYSRAWGRKGSRWEGVPVGKEAGAFIYWCIILIIVAEYGSTGSQNLSKCKNKKKNQLCF